MGDKGYENYGVVRVRELGGERAILEAISHLAVAADVLEAAGARKIAVAVKEAQLKADKVVKGMRRAKELRK